MKSKLAKQPVKHYSIAILSLLILVLVMATACSQAGRQKDEKFSALLKELHQVDDELLKISGQCYSLGGEIAKLNNAIVDVVVKSELLTKYSLEDSVIAERFKTYRRLPKN